MKKPNTQKNAFLGKSNLNNTEKIFSKTIKDSTISQEEYLLNNDEVEK